MFTKQKLGKGNWVVQYETILERFTVSFSSDKKATEWIKSHPYYKATKR